MPKSLILVQYRMVIAKFQKTPKVMYAYKYLTQQLYRPHKIQIRLTQLCLMCVLRLSWSHFIISVMLEQLNLFSRATILYL